MRTTPHIPETHPLRRLVYGVADRALTQSSLSDKDILLYLSDLLLDFVSVQNLQRLRDGKGQPVAYPLEMFRSVSDVPESTKKEHYQQIGDYSLFLLGMFPESVSRGRRALTHSDYAAAGRRGYWAASELELDSESVRVFRKLADEFERCVVSLNWVRTYTTDPFYQYMLRQFGVTP